ncbi:MAG: hypothetical protein JKY50_09765, partial [Oleispira sp.]|nr:hypothetical protein [Oleispira sp.]
MTPKEIAHELDRHIIGQSEAKRAVAITLRPKIVKNAIRDATGAYVLKTTLDAANAKLNEKKRQLSIAENANIALNARVNESASNLLQMNELAATQRNEFLKVEKNAEGNNFIS